MSTPLFNNDFLRKLEYLNLIARRLVFGRRQALRDSARKGASIEFKDFREYSPGDDPRTVDWSVYARLGELVIKLYRQEEELDLWVLLDSSASMGFGDPSKFDHARRIAAALTYIGLSNMDSATIAPFAELPTPSRRRVRNASSILPMLGDLETLKPQGRTDLSKVVRSLSAMTPRPGLVVVVSDFYGLRNAQQAIRHLHHQRHQVQVIQVSEPDERRPALRGEYQLVDSESGAERAITITDALLAKYQKRYEDLCAEIKRFCMKHSVGYAFAPTEDPFDRFLRTRLLTPGGLLR